MFLPQPPDVTTIKYWRLGAQASPDLDFEAAERAAIWLLTALEPNYQAAQIANAGLSGMISPRNRVETEIAVPRAVDRLDNCISQGRLDGTRFCKYLDRGSDRPPGRNGDKMIGEWSETTIKRDYCKDGSKRLGNKTYVLTGLDGIIGLARHIAFRYTQSALRLEPLDPLIERGEL